MSINSCNALSPFCRLPDDSLRIVLSFMEIKDLGRAEGVCKFWRECIQLKFLSLAEQSQPF